MDYSNCPPSGRYYSGSERKLGVTVGGFPYMLKFQKKSEFGLRFNHISEYLGSHIFSMLGLPTQDTYLGTYQGEQVVACKDFIVDNVEFVPFNEVGESTLEQDKELYQYSYEDITKMLRDNSKLTHVEETIAAFWQIYVVDAFLGNFDRHGSNWGFLKKDNLYSLAPVFDNGSCLFPAMTDEAEMLHIISSEDETLRRVFTFPASQIKLHGKKSSYYEVIHSCAYPECNAALRVIMERLDRARIDDLIEQTPFITDIHKDFYRHMLSARYRHILLDSFLHLGGKRP